MTASLSLQALPVDRNLLTRGYTHKAIEFIRDNKDKPFFVYLPHARSPHEAFYYYYMEQLQAVRSGRWKLHLPLEAKWTSFRGDTTSSEAELYDLTADVGETRNLAAEHPDVVGRLLALAKKAREDLGDVGRPGKGQRPAGMVTNPTPRVL